jgi:hypothetical protein
MNAKIKRMIVGYARRLSGSWEPRNNVKRRAKVAPALHRCAKCGSLNYEGDSVKTFNKYVDQFPNDKVNFDGIEIDHIQPIVKLSGWTNWEDFFSSLFCDEDGLRPLCHDCHSKKTANENSHRTYKPKRAKGKTK